MVLAMAGFAVEDAFIKSVSGRIPIGQVLIYMGLAGWIGFSLLARRKGYRAFGRGFWHPAVMLRNGTEILGTASYLWTLTILPLALTSALAQAVPLFVTLGAILFFDAKVGWRRWLAIGIGLAGVLVILRPGFEGFRPEALFGVFAAIALAARDLATRPIPPTIHPLQLAAWGFLAVVPAGLVLLPLSGGMVQPSGLDMARIGAAILASMAAYYALTRAMQTGEIAFVTPFRYIRLVFAMIFGWALFAERPDGLTLLGAAIVIGAGLYTLWRERALMRRPKISS